MDKLDGSQLSNMKQWRCDKNKDHVLGAIQREEVKLVVDGMTLRYYTPQLLIFREAIDYSAEVPAEIEIAGMLNCKMLSMFVWKCSVKYCGGCKEWHPDDETTDYLVKTYLAE